MRGFGSKKFVQEQIRRYGPVLYLLNVALITLGVSMAALVVFFAVDRPYLSWRELTIDIVIGSLVCSAMGTIGAVFAVLNYLSLHNRNKR